MPTHTTNTVRSTQPESARGTTNASTDTYGTAMLYDVDPAEINRFERRQKQWQRCVQRYKEALLEDFATLKASARYGLTRAQAEAIARKLARIQATVLSPDGVAEAAAEDGPG